MLFPTQKIAEECRSFMQTRSAVLGSPITARLVHVFICPEELQNGNTPTSDKSDKPRGCADLHIVLFPADAFPIAKQFWQHTGLGISSRLAERCLTLLPKETPVAVQRPASPVLGRFPAKGHNRHYSSMKSPPSPSSPNQKSTFNAAPEAEDLNPDTVYLEERYGRNLPLEAASFAKRALRSRVAGILLRDSSDQPCSEQKELVVGPSVRGISTVAADDVYLFPTGMSAIWNAHAAARATRPPAKSVCFGYVYKFAFCQYSHVYAPDTGSRTPTPSKSLKNGARDATSLALARTATSTS
jgi:cystathionine gamma-synthase